MRFQYCDAAQANLCKCADLSESLLLGCIAQNCHLRRLMRFGTEMKATVRRANVQTRQNLSCLHKIALHRHLSQHEILNCEEGSD